MTDADLEALRRRLYSPDSTSEDRARFAAALRSAREAETAAVPTPAQPEPGAGIASAPVRTGRRRRVALIAAGVAVLGVVTGGAVALVARPVPASTPVLALHPLDVGEAARADLRRYADQGVQTLPSDDFAGALFQAGFGAFPPTSTTAVSGGDGSGAGTVRTDPWSAAGRGGHVTVVLVLAKDGPAAVRAASIDGAAEHPLGAGSLRALTGGTPAVTRFAFPAERLPTVFRVTAERGTAWILELVYSR